MKFVTNFYPIVSCGTLISTTSVITTFGGERATEPVVSYGNTKKSVPSVDQGEFRQALCNDLNLPVGPRFHEDCGKKVQRPGFNVSDSSGGEKAIKAAYKHVYGNAHVMESERDMLSESQLMQGNICVREFVRNIAKSDFYIRNFYSKCAPIRSIELNMKHILGRSPRSAEEISFYIQIQANHGHNAVVDHMIDSAEYLETFGMDTVPYMHSWKSSAAGFQSSFNRTAALSPGFSCSDKAIGNKSLFSMNYGKDANYKITPPAAAAIKLTMASRTWPGGQPPAMAKKAGAVLVVAGSIEVIRIILVLIISALTS